MISRLGRLLAETGKATPQAILEQASRPGRSAGTLARALEDFFTDAGLAFPADHAARREAARRQRRIQETPEPLRQAVARYAAALTTAQQRARRAGTRPRADRTLADDLAVLRDLALFLAARQAKTDWATVQAADLEAFLAVRPASRARRLTTLRAFFRWARASRLILADPATGIRAGRPRGYHPRTLAVAEQRRLFRRWTTDPAVHPHEALAGLLALLHATPSRELRNLKVTDIDTAAHTIRLGRRPHPVPLDPASWHALQRCLEHREQLATRNPHVIVTTHTRTRRTAPSDQYLVRILDPAGIGTRTLRATRIIDLVASLDPKLVCQALGMNPAGILPYAADQVQDTRLANL
jgi:site-specific recombinase XerD